MSKDEEKGIVNVLKWAGILALVTVPLVAYLKKKKGDQSIPGSSDDDSNIFEAELKG